VVPVEVVVLVAELAQVVAVVLVVAAELAQVVAVVLDLVRVAVTVVMFQFPVAVAVDVPMTGPASMAGWWNILTWLLVPTYVFARRIRGMK